MTDLHSKLQKGTNEILEASELVREQLKVLDERMACWDEIQNRIQEAKKKSNKKVVLDVGGKKFATYSSTLLKHETSYFTALLLNGEMQDVDGSYFIDRNPKYFGVLLDFLRTGTLDYEDFTEKNIDKLKDEFKFYSVPYPKPRYSFSDGNTTATMLKNYLVNKGTLLESGKHSWSIRADNVVPSFDVGVVSPSHTAHFSKGTPTAWGLRENGYCLYGQTQVGNRIKNGDILTFHLDLDSKTLRIDHNKERVSFEWNDVKAPVHIAFSGSKGSKVTIIE